MYIQLSLHAHIVKSCVETYIKCSYVHMHIQWSHVYMYIHVYSEVICTYSGVVCRYVHTMESDLSRKRNEIMHFRIMVVGSGG